ncbi:NarK/NasA family nitrate transporter [Tumebacillus sp. DT12]|uniref:NarK/NasA family nitrate transporter n=1 Tax=Tumebacillus lacus TaxID=2995335 RepID=A0ABT3WUY9_9BACL|nr:nitrate/nitrite transporter [Tumebacillus lacus]MCX7568488.1 NarK/NasA family nitrate transporter [Tumebacillus lacus]
MNIRTFAKDGHWPTLFSSFLYFDVSFMIWVLLGAVSTFITADFGLSASQKGMLVGIPILGGALLRIPLGLFADRYGGKRVGLIGMAVTMIPLLWGWLYGQHLSELYAFGLLLGVAGASFSVALPLASRWYRPEHQGLAMGIAGAGNSGTVLATLFGPRLAEHFGWHAVFGFALLPLFAAFLVFLLCVKESPNRPQPQKIVEYLTITKRKETWLFSFFYSLSFGGFVGLTSYLSLFFVDQYGISKVQAGDFVTLIVFGGSFIRPIGGYLADRFGGSNLLVRLFALAGLVLIGVGFLPTFWVCFVLLFLTLLLFGACNGSLFQVVPTRFPREVGVMTGFIGAAGGLGGFFVPMILGTLKDWTGSYSYGFWWFALTAFAAMVVLIALQRDWKRQASLLTSTVQTKAKAT